MQLQWQELQQHKRILELALSWQSVKQEVCQIGQLAAEVNKLHQEAEAARLEALALDREPQLSWLLDRLRLDPSVTAHVLPLILPLRTCTYLYLSVPIYYCTKAP